jgi:predicted nucleic acid-binding protein
VAEVAFRSIESQQGQLDDGALASIEALWVPQPGIVLVDIGEDIARGARDLMRAALPRGWRLKPNDAIHLATAAVIGADVVHTYDRTLWKYGELLGIPVHEPRDPA